MDEPYSFQCVSVTTNTSRTVPSTAEVSFTLIPSYIDPMLIDLCQRRTNPADVFRQEFKAEFVDEILLEDATVDELLNELKKRLK